METEPAATQPLLAVSGLRKNYGLQTVLRGVDLMLCRGERMAIMGPSGSGKSTLLNCIAGLEQADGGTIVFAGLNYAMLDVQAMTELRRSAISSVFQFFHLLPTLNAYENVEFPLLLNGVQAALRRRKVMQLLEEVGLTQRMHASPDQLSGGEMQRLAIARALIIEPRLLLADEPTGSLDSANGGRILQLLKDLTVRHGTALLMATHDADAAAICERVQHLRDGSWVVTDATDATAAGVARAG